MKHSSRTFQSHFLLLLIYVACGNCAAQNYVETAANAEGNFLSVYLSLFVCYSFDLIKIIASALLFAARCSDNNSISQKTTFGALHNKTIFLLALPVFILILFIVVLAASVHEIKEKQRKFLYEKCFSSQLAFLFSCLVLVLWALLS